MASQSGEICPGKTRPHGRALASRLEAKQTPVNTPLPAATKEQNNKPAKETALPSALWQNYKNSGKQHPDLKQ
jgi:hypothetical protein